MLSRSQRLCRTLDLIVPLALEPTSRLLERRDCARLYPEYRIACYSVSKGYDALIPYVLGRASDLAADDPVAACVADYLPQYVLEEADEDHLADLEVLGFDRAEVENRRPSPSVAAMVGSQFFWSLHVHPVAFLGAIQVAEAYTPTLDVVEKLVERTGHPREAFASLVEHAERDVAHRAHLHEVMDDLPISREHESLISLCAFQSVALLGQALGEIFERSEGQ